MRKQLKFVLASIVLAGFTVALYAQRFQVEKTAGIKKEFPSQICEWVSTEVPFSPEVEAVLRPDYYVYKSFSKKGASNVALFLARYDEIEKADLSHSPIVCFTGQGWEIEKVTERTIELTTAATPRINANLMVLRKMNARLVVLYWYQSADRALASRGHQKLILFLDQFSGKPVTNAFVRLTSPIEAGRTFEETTAELCRFVTEVFPRIENYVEHP